ncbi:ribonucleotide reductase [Gracilibacillus boraciitolerans JCM 21714]|uniref:Ribonucleotide reductase n=1 Tax=Gracilibacillus boraciitolerans JCM 21714 TaxID=1298598 RepID=W4VJF1_9BACI|nr:ribonucleotide reductase [Gracilibacillus boraciitolerans JCM 21714]
MTTEVKSIKQSVIQALQEAEEKYGLDTTDIQKRIEASTKLDKDTTQEALFYSLNRIAMDQPNWTFVAAQFLLQQLYETAAQNRGYKADQQYGEFYHLIESLTNIGIYNKDILTHYSKDEIDDLQLAIQPERDNLFNYIGLFLLADRYLARDHDRNLYELPQERFMVIAMTLMQNEAPEKRQELVKEAYWL